VADSVRILLIDDDQVDRAAVRRALTRSGLAHDLIEAADGQTGRRLAAEQHFDCILLDYRLPDVDAFDLLADLNSLEGGAHSVLVLTGEADQDRAFQLMRAGALDYLTKDEATPSSLARAIRYAGARREVLRELDKARHDAELKSQELDTLNRQKALLFSIIAHDLRNPFQALLGLSTMLLKAVTEQNRAAVARRANALRDAADQAYELMESLFAWAKIQMDTLETPLSEVQLGPTADEAMTPIIKVASDKGIRLSASFEPIAVMAHRDMLVTVLRNLISNAIKFTLPAGAVTIAARCDGGQVEVAITDTGIGMTQATIADLFNTDKRMTTAGTAGERGSGFGLLICQSLLERMGARLEVESVIGRGTTFRFYLPAVDSPASRCDPPQTSDAA
jgi:two-component system sensor histidine kinase/response regulator